jgi:hypothetical protein
MNHHSQFALLILMLGAAGLVHGEDDGAHWIDAGPGCKVFAARAAADLKASWAGACENGYAEGEGKLTWSDGNRYEGQVHGGMADGKGRYDWANGVWYEGNFKEGHRDGIGTQYFGCSGRYQGTFHAGVIDGIGTFYLANGDRYEGDVRNGKMEGVGMLYMAHGNRYEGAFHGGVVEGLGAMYFANGNRYEGDFRSGHQDGFGTLFEANGTSYEGGFKADHPEGQAVVSYASGDRYQGMYVDGHAEGRGIYTKKNGERDVAIFKEGRAGLTVVSRIGPPLYQPCHDFCNASITGCSTVVGTMSAPSPPGGMAPGIDRYGQCAIETNQCVESCRENNPTAGDVHGIIEIGPLQPPGETLSPGDIPASRENKGSTPEASILNGGGGSPEFTMEQAGATAALRANLKRQRRELAELRQQAADRHQTAVAMQSAAASPGKCRPGPAPKSGTN